MIPGVMYNLYLMHPALDLIPTGQTNFGKIPGEAMACDRSVTESLLAESRSRSLVFATWANKTFLGKSHIHIRVSPTYYCP